MSLRQFFSTLHPVNKTVLGPGSSATAGDRPTATDKGERERDVAASTRTAVRPAAADWPLLRILEKIDTLGVSINKLVAERDALARENRELRAELSLHRVAEFHSRPRLSVDLV